MDFDTAKTLPNIPALLCRLLGGHAPQFQLTAELALAKLNAKQSIYLCNCLELLGGIVHIHSGIHQVCTSGKIT
jgi:hypothetical protein